MSTINSNLEIQKAIKELKQFRTVYSMFHNESANYDSLWNQYHLLTEYTGKLSIYLEAKSDYEWFDILDQDEKDDYGDYDNFVTVSTQSIKTDLNELMTLAETKIQSKIN